MTRKDYKAIAEIISTVRTQTKEHSLSGLASIGRLQEEMETTLQNDNDKFDLVRFRKACWG